MERHQAKHIRRELTADERARVNEARRLVEAEAPEIRRKAKQHKQEYDASHATLQEALQLLKAERMRQGLSLSDIQERTGIERPTVN